MRRTRTTALALGSALVAGLAFAPAAWAGEAGAGGAPLTDVVWGTVVGTILAVGAVTVGHLHRTRRISALHRLGELSSRMSGLPPWAALPAAVTGLSLELALFGFWWDVATHIDNGRDEGAFGNIAHWPILLGLGGIALGGFLAVVLAASEKEPSAVRLGPGWHAPVGGLMILASGSFAMTGFPLDDTWHRLFGQDVTLWGPTHVLMIASAALATLGVWALLVEGRRATRRAAIEEAAAKGRRFDGVRETVFVRFRGPAIAGGFLIALSALQGEFDFGVPQYSLLLHPVMLAIAASVGLVTARVVLGPGGALKAVGFYLVVRVLLTTLVGPVFGYSTQHFPLYVAEALIVEAVALRFAADRPLRLGLVAGALIGTVGFAAEWAWSHVWMPIAWPEAILPEAAVLALAAAVAGGVLGAFLGGTLRFADPPRSIGPAWAATAAVAVIALTIALPIPKSDGDPVTARITLEEVSPAPERTVSATVRLDPPDAADDAAWLTATAWQGGGLVVDPLEKAGEGVYRTTEPLPVHGNWKALIRLADGRALDAVPVRLPADPEIPAEAVPAQAEATRTFVSDKSILQREAKSAGGALTLAAYLVLGLIMAAELAGIAWALRRLRLTAQEAEAPPATAGPPAPTAPRRQAVPG